MNRANLCRHSLPSELDELLPVQAESLPQILIYANGSCLKNPTAQAQAGVGVVLLTEDRQRIKLKACYLGSTTNQQAEIMSCVLALESLQTPCRVSLNSDSNYVVEAMLGKSEMKSNRDFWNRLVNAALTHKIEWKRTPRNAGDMFQETANRLSRAAAIAQSNLSKDTLDKLVDLLQGKPNEDVTRMIHNGLKTLAAQCDGAHKADGQGFNKFDSEMGKRFAQKSSLTPTEIAVARAMLTKYRAQIVRFDVQLALLV